MVVPATGASAPIAFSSFCGRRSFGVNDPLAGCHPVHVTRQDSLLGAEIIK
jgi:hypothetical protein